MNKGFTLIEVVVVLTIIVIITGIIIFNVGTERQNSALLRSAQKLSLDLRRAQSFALSSKTYKTAGVPCGWGVHFNGLGSTNYIIFADLAPVAQDCSSSNRDYVRAIDGSEDFEVANFEASITISGNLSDVVFSPPDPIVNFTPDQTSAGIVLTNKNGATRAININKTGFISSP